MAKSKSRDFINTPVKSTGRDYDVNQARNQIINSLTSLTSGLVGFAAGRGLDGNAPANIRNLSLISNNLRSKFITTDPIQLGQLFTQFPEVRRYIQQPNRDAMRGILGKDIKIKLYVVDNRDLRQDDEDANTPSKIHKMTPFDKMMSWVGFGKSGRFVKNSANSEDDNDVKKMSGDVNKTMTASLGDKIREEQYNDFKAAQEANKKLAEMTGRLSADRGLRRLSAYEEQIVMDKMEEECDLETIKIALDWKDLYGGAGIVVDTVGNPDSYLNISKIQKGDPLSFKTANNWQLGGVNIKNINVESVNMEWSFDSPFFYNAIELDKSRVLTLKGDPMPYPFAGYTRGWGMSKLEPVIASLNKRIKSDNVVYELLDEAKVDVLKIHGFDDIRIDEEGEKDIQKKGEIMAWMKNYLNMIMMDAQDEYASKQTTFSGLSEIINQSRVDLTASFGLPETKLWGFSAAGFNSGGADIQTYHEKIESEYRPNVKRIIKWMAKLRARQMLGKDVVVMVDLPPLDLASPMDQAKMNVMMLDTISKFSPAGNGILTSRQVYEILNEMGAFPIDFDPAQEIVPNPQMGNNFVRTVG